jgi:hypothetical protein
MTAAVAVSTPAHAEWKQYRDDSLGIYSYFPSEPVKTTGTYKAQLAKDVPSIILTAKDGDVTFRVEVVDFEKRAAEGANLMMEALNRDAGGRGNTFTVTDFPLWDKGANAVYGTAVIIDKNDKDKTHIVEQVVFNKGKLYIISASVPGTSPGRNSPGLARFIDSSQFYLKGYGINYETGHDYPLGDDDPLNRDNRPAAPDYTPPAGLVSGPLEDVVK